MMSETNRTKAVRIREIVAGDQLGLDFGGVDFWTGRPVSELISEEEWSALYEAHGIAG